MFPVSMVVLFGVTADDIDERVFWDVIVGTVNVRLGTVRIVI